mmetsp:Transcript_3980/g.6663  ORF Transcript_3980/g.6663 Transcript_3980/m.6663 type:complete len:127 (-) Transcript_3980:400-780(-)
MHLNGKRQASPPLDCFIHRHRCLPRSINQQAHLTMGRTTRSSARLAANTVEKPEVAVPEKKVSPKKAAKKSKAAAPTKKVVVEEKKAPNVKKGSKKTEEEPAKEEEAEDAPKGDKKSVVSIEACKQ